MKKIITCLISSIGLLITVNTFAQTQYQYTYDDAGNRVQRKVIVEAAARKANPNASNTSSVKTLTSVNGQPTAGSNKKKTSVSDGTAETDQYINVNVYPNPVQDKLKIEFAAKDNIIMHYTLSDSNGRVLLDKENVSQRDEINLSGYQTGVYFLSITDNNNNQYEYKVSKVK